MTYKRKKYHYGDTHLARRWRTRNRKRDLDQIDEDLKPEKSEALLNQEVDVDKPGDAQHYCLHCARYFIDNQALTEHFRTKVHKRRLKALELEPYSIEDSERAAGHGNFIPPKKRKIETQEVVKKEEMLIDKECTSERPVFIPNPDITNKFKDLQKLNANLEARKINTNANALKILCDVHNELKEMRNTLEIRRASIAEEMKSLQKSKGKDGEESMERLRLEGRVVREDLKKLLIGYWEIEEKVMIGCLDLPNDLHPDSPISEEKVINVFGQSSGEGLPHVEATDLIDYRNPQCYYLKKDAALFDLALPEYFRHNLCLNRFIPMSGPDFAAAALVEGCGTPIEKSIGLEPKEKKFYLVGGSAIYPFCAYYAKQGIPVDQLPIRHVSSGRKYSKRVGPGLFGSWQRQCVDFISISTSPDMLAEEYDKISRLLSSLYDGLEWKTRVVHIPAPALRPWESFRLSFQMYSVTLKQWVEVGNVSISGSFFSERMSIKYGNKGDDKSFCHILSGTSVDSTSVLACLLEEKNYNLFPFKLSPFVLA